MRFLGLSHIALRVSDLAQAKTFYVDKLGFQVVEETPTRVLMHHRGLLIGILGNNPNTPSSDTFNPFRVGVDHLALTVPNRKALERLKQDLDAAGIRNNGVEKDAESKADYISFYDPDGIAWEFYVIPLMVRVILGLAGLIGFKLPAPRR